MPCSFADASGQPLVAHRDPGAVRRGGEQADHQHGQQQNAQSLHGLPRVDVVPVCRGEDARPRVLVAWAWRGHADPSRVDALEADPSRVDAVRRRPVVSDGSASYGVKKRRVGVVVSARGPCRARQAADRRPTHVRRGGEALRRDQRRPLARAGPALAARRDRGGRPAARGAGPRPGRRDRHVEPALRRPRRARGALRLLARHARGSASGPGRTCRSPPATAPGCRSPTTPSTP